MTLSKHWKIIVLLVVILGFSTLLPINIGKPNFFGSFTLCSFAPIATVAMFVLGLSVYSFVNKRKLLLYGNVFLLLLIIGFTGFWVYNAKLPLDSIEMNITNVRFWIGEDPFWVGGPANTSSIFFDVTLYNPTSRDISAFHSENSALRINDKLTAPDIMAIDISLLEPLNAYSRVRSELYVIFVQNYTDPEVWASLHSKNFTFTISGVLVVRWQYSIVWASKPYSVSYTYTE